MRITVVLMRFFDFPGRGSLIAVILRSDILFTKFDDWLKAAPCPITSLISPSFCLELFLSRSMSVHFSLSGDQLSLEEKSLPVPIIVDFKARIRLVRFLP